MKKLYSLFLLMSAGCACAQAADGTYRLPLDLNIQKTVELDEKYSDAVKKAPSARTEESDADWKLLGTGRYTDDILTNSGLSSETWEVEIYESTTTPGFYKVENPYGNGNCPYFEEPFESCDFLMHAENPDAVWMEYVRLDNIDFGLKTDDGSICFGYTSDVAGYYISEGYVTPEQAVEMNMTSGKMAYDCITFAAKSLVLDFPDNAGESLSLSANLSGFFCVALPGAPDFSFSIRTNEACTEGSVDIAYTAGADVAEVKYGLYKGMLSFESVDEELFEKVRDEGAVAKDETITVAPESGINTVAIVALNSDGVIVGNKTFYCIGQHEEPDEWTSIGMAEYSEDVLASIYPTDVSNTVYNVEIQESNTTPGRYRLIDLYGPAYPFYSNFEKDNNILEGHNHHHYTVVDASNPDMVYIEASPLGTDFGYGPVMMFSEGWLYMQLGADLTKPAVLEGFGTLRDGKITFLGGAIFLYMEDYGMPRGNINHKFYIKLPASSSVSEVAADPAAPVYYNMYGVRLAGTPSVPGVYIKVSGGEAEKIHVK